MAFGWPPSTYNSHERAGYHGGRNFSAEEAQKYARAFSVSAAWLLTGEGEPPQNTMSENSRLSSKLKKPSLSPLVESPPLLLGAPKKLPIYGLATGDDDGRLEFSGTALDTIDCPPGLEAVPDAYAVWVSGETMSPRFKPGELVFVHPQRPARRGDDVVVHLAPDGSGGPSTGFIKEFDVWTPTELITWQHNPSKEVPFERSRVQSVHVIIGQFRT